MWLVNLEKELGVQPSVPILISQQLSESIFVLHPFRQEKTPSSAKESVVILAYDQVNKPASF